MEREVSVKAKEAERRVISPSAEDNSIINSPPPQRKPQANQEPPSATSTFKRRFSFKRLTMTKNSKN